MSAPKPTVRDFQCALTLLPDSICGFIYDAHCMFSARHVRGWPLPLICTMHSLCIAFQDGGSMADVSTMFSIEQA